LAVTVPSTKPLRKGLVLMDVCSLLMEEEEEEEEEEKQVTYSKIIR
jgi:hypothetical protein